MIFPGNDWDEIIKSVLDEKLLSSLAYEYQNYSILPSADLIFESFRLCSYEKCTVVILGQDPYIHPEQAEGLAFSVPHGIKLPPSLKNIYRELENDLGVTSPNGGSLRAWAEQGVLLLNTVLTVREGLSNSHANIGWQDFTDQIIVHLARKKDPIVFVLWGRQAQKKISLIGGSHFIIQAAHPSPLSARTGFFGSKPFSKINEFHELNGDSPINW